MFIMNPIGGVDDARHDETADSGGLEAGDHSSDIACLEMMPTWIRWRFRVADAQLVNVDITGCDSRVDELRLELPADGRLADHRRAAQPHDGKPAMAHGPALPKRLHLAYESKVNTIRRYEQQSSLASAAAARPFISTIASVQMNYRDHLGFNVDLHSAPGFPAAIFASA